MVIERENLNNFFFLGFKDEDIESHYMNEYLKCMKVKDQMKYLEKNKVIITQVNFLSFVLFLKFYNL